MPLLFLHSNNINWSNKRPGPTTTTHIAQATQLCLPESRSTRRCYSQMFSTLASQTHYISVASTMYRKDRSHLLYPLTSVFHALVPSGSMWMAVPDRAGPITNHLQRLERELSLFPYTNWSVL